MIFWLVCAVFVAIALAFVLPPLLPGAGKKAHDAGQKEANIAVYRDQIAELTTDLGNGLISREQYEQDRVEMERRMLDDVASSSEGKRKAKPEREGRRAVYLVALGLPVLAVAIYLRIGNPNATSTTVPSQPATTASGEVSQQRIEANVAALARRLEQNSNDVQGWIMLARSYTALAKYKEASQAYARATALKTDDADLWADYAFVLATANGEKLAGEPTEIIAKALKLDPENPKALELAGIAAFEVKDYKRAIDYWQKLMNKLSPNSEEALSLSQRIQEAQTRAGSPPAK
ncbi:MAG: c-type cytochrome biogenesis protein CcmI [Pyrinomonadaceae bacterium]